MKKNEIIGIILTIVVIGVIFFSGTAKAITLGVTGLSASVSGTQTVSFQAKVDLHNADVLLEDTNFTVTMTADGAATYTCTFDIDGNPLSTCTGITVALASSDLGTYEQTYGNLYGYAYNYSDSSFTTGWTNFSAQQAYGYAYNSGVGEDAYSATLTDGELVFNITWTTPSVAADTNYSIDFEAYVSDGTNARRYEADGSMEGTITVGSVSDVTAVAAAKAALTEDMILMDDAAEYVIANVYLPTTLNGVTIGWTSSDAGVIATTGVVNRPVANTSVTLTADFTKGVATDSEEFTFTVLAEVAAAAQTNGTVTVDEDNETEVLIDGTNIDDITTITVGAAIAEDEPVSLNFESLLAGNTLTLDSSALTLERETATYTYTTVIQNDTVITGPAEWNGIISLPTVREESGFTAPSGSTNAVIDLGSGVELNLSRPAKVVLGGMSGKRAAWTRTGTTLTAISTVCDSATAPTNINDASPRECYISSGSDLVIWTYHFTKFAAYTPTTIVHHGGGGSSSSTPITSSYTTYLITLPTDFYVTKDLAENEVVKFPLSGETHTVTIKDILTNGVVLDVMSTLQTVTMTIGDTRYFDLDEDGMADLSISARSIESGKVKLSFKNNQAEVTSTIEPITGDVVSEIEEPVETTETQPQEQVVEQTPQEQPVEEQPPAEAEPSKASVIFPLILVIVIVAGLAAGYYFYRKKSSDWEDEFDQKYKI